MQYICLQVDLNPVFWRFGSEYGFFKRLSSDPALKGRIRNKDSAFGGSRPGYGLYGRFLFRSDRFNLRTDP